MPKQIHRSAAYLSHNKYGYCFRLKVPDDLRCYVGNKELRYSLKTGYLGNAKLTIFAVDTKRRQPSQWPH